MKRRRQIALDCLLLFFGAAILVRPYLFDKFTDQWASIESTFIADARFLMAHWPHPQWQPLWYTGTRFDYIYPPALRYGTAIVSMITGYWPVKAYHFYTIFFYCLGIAGVYLLMRAAGRARAFAFLGAAFAALTSPAFLFMRDMRQDSAFLVPVRLGVLLRYGEGPHITALSLTPFALGFAWLALERRSAVWVALAAIFSAAVVSNNFYGATSLAILYSTLVWSFWVCGPRRGEGGSMSPLRRIALPAAAIPVLAYGLTAFWLTPSYLRLTSHNMPIVQAAAGVQAGTLSSYWVALIVVAAYVSIALRFARSRPGRTWAVFVAGFVVFSSLNVLGNHYFGFILTGDPHRLVPELDLALILGAVLVFEWLWRRRSRAPRIAVIVAVALVLITAQRYVRHAWHVVARWPDYTSRLEYHVTDWLWQHMPDARVASAGTVRFWFDAWHDLDELGGGSDQSVLNPVVQEAQWEITQGTELAPSRLWLESLGVDAIYVEGPKSEEPYKDYNAPQKFAALPLLYDDGRDNKIYGISRRYPARARVVESARLSAQKAPVNIEDVERLRAYADVVENGPDSPPALERQGTDAMLVRAQVEPGQAVLVQETWDPAWQAWSDGRRLLVHPDIMGFMVVDAPPGNREILLRFVTPLENQIGRLLTGISLLLLVWLFVRRERAR